MASDPTPAVAGDSEALRRAQRVRGSQALLALVIYLTFAVVQHVEVIFGMIDEAASWWLTSWNLGGGVLFYALIRSGLNLRWRGDAALTFPQTLWAVVGVAWSYAITGPARGGVMLIMVLLLVFGIFALSPRQSRLLAAAAFSLLAAGMFYKGWTEPQRYEPRVEVLHFVFAAIVIGAVAALAERLGKLRARLVKQRGELAAALERIQALATRDELTGLLNRRAAMDGLRAELRRRDRSKPTMCVALIDLDHFKRINDSYGHAAGDRVLRAFAEAAAAEIRAPDVLARWGGEEFLLMMPATDEPEGLRCLERIRRRLAELTFDDVAPALRITFSAGLSACADERDVEPAIDRADRAMYMAKHSGRDRIVSFAADAQALAAAPAAEASAPA